MASGFSQMVGNAAGTETAGVRGEDMPPDFKGIDVEQLLEAILGANEGIWKWPVIVVKEDEHHFVTRVDWEGDGKAMILTID
jgi:hypothetical protein